MSFWMDQNLEALEDMLNYIGDKLRIECAPTLKDRLFILREKKHSLFSEQSDETCECSGGKDTFTVLRPDCDGYLCLAPVVALIQGSDRIQNWICHDLKKALFPAFKFTRQPKVTEYFRQSTMNNTKGKDDTERQEKLDDYPECSLKCALNEWKDGVCFIRFVRHFKVNLRIHKSNYGGCRWVLGEENKDNPTVHLHYASGYSLVLPPVSDFHHLPTKNIVSEEQMEYYRSNPPISVEKMNFYKSQPPPQPTQATMEATQYSNSKTTQSPHCHGANDTQSSPPPPFIAFSTPSQEMPIRNTAFYYESAMSTAIIHPLSQEDTQKPQSASPTGDSTPTVSN